MWESNYIIIVDPEEEGFLVNTEKREVSAPTQEAAVIVVQDLQVAEVNEKILQRLKTKFREEEEVITSKLDTVFLADGNWDLAVCFEGTPVFVKKLSFVPDKENIDYPRFKVTLRLAEIGVDEIEDVVVEKANIALKAMLNTFREEWTLYASSVMPAADQSIINIDKKEIKVMATNDGIEHGKQILAEQLMKVEGPALCKVLGIDNIEEHPKRFKIVSIKDMPWMRFVLDQGTIVASLQMKGKTDKHTEESGDHPEKITMELIVTPVIDPTLEGIPLSLQESFQNLVDKEVRMNKIKKKKTRLRVV